MIPLSSGVTDDPEMTQCRKFPSNNWTTRNRKNGWTSCDQFKPFLPSSGGLFDKMCPSHENFGFRCTRKVLKCGGSGNINLCVIENPVYNSQSKTYKAFQNRIKKWPITNFNSTLALARKLRPSNGSDNGAFDALSNIWLRHRHPRDYIRIKKSLAKLHISKSTLSCIMIQLCHLLGSKNFNGHNNFSAELVGRIKTIYSIWSKEQQMAKGKRESKAIVDQLSVKIIVDSVHDCYVVRNETMRKFSISHTNDYIARPRKSGYQAIHLIVLGLYANQFVEMQILTKAMNRAQVGEDHTGYKTMQDEFLYE